MQIDQLKQLTEKLNDRDRERDILIRELQFRLKDSLQSVTSLLALVARDSDSEEAADVLNSTIYRVQVMASIYDLACESANVADVSMRHIVDRILSNAVQLFPCPKCHIDVDVDDISLPIHIAMPAAQILGEMLINSMRQAARVDGMVHVVMNRTGISVVPAGRDGYDQLGMYLIGILTEQLGGTATRDGKTLNVNIDLYNTRVVP